ncbi:sirohydrochlorin chelatase [Paenarthrobacter sp. Z7-10]|uniref:sirohydrochlorin chelatase n=1 Tax=Paenarthrobacter sp. Z7-10 TaxID=2787635 RepID=UPI0022A9CDCD|nr:CbiX/SirB N-terminal domain-containing protein [Paenarthrobacter sp. Z7-10]MCZ2402292.1 sirohydrochlorin chelatase [Paenarthrobacter sp. Z7-10]
MSPTTAPVLIACAHGTRSGDGQQRLFQLRAAVAAQQPGLNVLEAYVDVQHPALTEVIAALPAGTPAVVVPLLLSVGYHVQVDIARAVASRPELKAAAPLGPDPQLARLLHDRLLAAGLEADDGVVLAAAGSSVPDADEDVREMARLLGSLIPNRIGIGYGASAEPAVPDAVAGLRAEGFARVVIASYLLAPGFFHQQLLKAGGDAVAGPLLQAGQKGPDQPAGGGSSALAELVVERYRAALAR